MNSVPSIASDAFPWRSHILRTTIGALGHPTAMTLGSFCFGFCSQLALIKPIVCGSSGCNTSNFDFPPSSFVTVLLVSAAGISMCAANIAISRADTNRHDESDSANSVIKRSDANPFNEPELEFVSLEEQVSIKVAGEVFPLVVRDDTPPSADSLMRYFCKHSVTRFLNGSIGAFAVSLALDCVFLDGSGWDLSTVNLDTALWWGMIIVAALAFGMHGYGIWLHLDEKKLAAAIPSDQNELNQPIQPRVEISTSSDTTENLSKASGSDTSYHPSPSQVNSPQSKLSATRHQPSPTVRSPLPKFFGQGEYRDAEVELNTFNAPKVVANPNVTLSPKAQRRDEGGLQFTDNNKFGSSILTAVYTNFGDHSDNGSYEILAINHKPLGADDGTDADSDSCERSKGY